MVAYTLPASTNRTAIRDGRRWLMLAAPRRNDLRNGHAGPGAQLHQRTPASATRQADYLPAVICAFSGVVTLSVEGVVRVLEQSAYPHGRSDAWADVAARRGEGLSNLLAQAEQASPGDRAGAADKIAVAAGFADYAALWASIRKNDGEVIARQLLAWVTP